MGLDASTAVRRRVAAHHPRSAVDGDGSPTRGSAASPAKPGAATAQVVMAPKYGAKVSKVRKTRRGGRGRERRACASPPRPLSPRFLNPLHIHPTQLAEAHAIVDDNDSTWSLGGLAVFAAFVVAAGAYLTVRVTELAAAGRLGAPWPAAVLAAELLGASSVGLYALCLARRLPASLTAVARSGAGRVPPGTHVHVLVPCYTEALTIVAETVWAAAEADLPPGATSTVWLLDDGADPAKKEWVAGLACPRIRYVAGRARPAGEVNGKAANLNAALASIYQRGVGAKPPGPHEAVAVFDADQVCDRAFFKKTLPLLFEEGGADGRGAPPSPSSPPSSSSARVGLVLTPQRYANVDERADIFNHSNRHFWEAMIPGLTSWGMVVCTGTNLVLRSTALMGVGGFPADTVTEDYLLGMELKMEGWEARYLAEYLAVGEAPEDGSLFRQRSRWCKGHLQALLSRAHCPLLQGRLSLLQRLLYASGAWAYITSAITTPLLSAVPVVALLSGGASPALPFALTPTLATAFLPYFLAVHAVVYWCDAPDLLRALWFGGVAARLLWWTYAKALWNTGLWALGLKRASRFKSTAKAGLGPSPSGRLAAAGGAAGLSPAASGEAAPAPSAPAAPSSPPPSVASWRDIWAPLLLAATSAAAAGVGIARIASGEEDSAALDVLTAWAAYNAVPPLLLAHYAWVGRGRSLRAACTLAALASTAVLAGAAFAGWLFLPPHIRGDAFGLGDRYTGGGGGLYAPAGPKAAFFADAILSALGADEAVAAAGGGAGGPALIGAPVAGPAGGGLRTSLGGR